MDLKKVSKWAGFYFFQSKNKFFQQSFLPKAWHIHLQIFLQIAHFDFENLLVQKKSAAHSLSLPADKSEKLYGLGQTVVRLSHVWKNFLLVCDIPVVLHISPNLLFCIDLMSQFYIASRVTLQRHMGSTFVDIVYFYLLSMFCSGVKKARGWSCRSQSQTLPKFLDNSFGMSLSGPNTCLQQWKTEYDC